MKLKQCCLVLITFWSVINLSIADIPEDTYLTVPQLIEKYNYTFEHHYVTTTDNYILALHRIPSGPIDPVVVVPQRRPPCVLLPGLWSSSAEFVLQGPGKALGYLLADEGYDIWMVNFRGGTYSRNHTTLSSTSRLMNSFWNFSFHEKGVFDLPAIIDYVLAETGDTEIILIGTSEGSTAFFVMGSEKPEYLPKVSVHICFAPAVFVYRTSFMLARAIAIFETFGYGTFISRYTGYLDIAPNGFVMSILNVFCRVHTVFSVICDNVISPVIDSAPGQIANSIIEVIIGHLPASTSSKQLLHFAQGVRKKNFGKYLNRYLDKYVPYKLSNITTPIYTFYGKKDKVVNRLDVELLEQKLPNGFVQKWLINDFGHVDFSLSKHAKALVYDQIVALLATLSTPI